MDYPTSNLQPGARGQEVTKLQNYLKQQGINVSVDGVYGPETKAAVASLQQKLGIDTKGNPGYWGPITIGSIQKTQTGGPAVPIPNGDSYDPRTGNYSGPTNPFTAAGIPEQQKTQEQLDAEYKTEVGNMKEVKDVTNGGSTLDEIINAFQTGDLSGIRTSTGQPFSAQDQAAAMSQGMEDNRLFYEAQQANDKATTENALVQKQADYQDWLLSQGDKFQTDRTNLNQNAVNQGVLFSGGNSQRQNKLQSSYNQAQSSKLATYGRDVADTANQYQYKYGTPAASGLSQYYNADANTYGMKTATGTVGSRGLSSIYNPNTYNYQGTATTERSAAAQKSAAGYLWNKGNKLLSTGYNNQIN